MRHTFRFETGNQDLERGLWLACLLREGWEKGRVCSA